jgi:hypothetical protein
VAGGSADLLAKLGLAVILACETGMVVPGEQA